MSTETAVSPQTAVELAVAKPEHVGELGRICYEAFKDITEKHGFRPDFPSAAAARQVIGLLVGREEFYGVAALVDGQPAGSNFLSLLDEVAGVGPITVEVPLQGQDIGRALMQDVIEYARRNQIRRVRLLQDAYNMASLSLYANLGFQVRDVVALMQPNPGVGRDPTVRAVTPDDLLAIERLGKRIYKASRRNEVALAIEAGFSPLLRERNGSISGYLIPGMLGHGVTESEEDALALIGEIAQRLPPEAAQFFCPLSEASFFRKVLQAGCRTIKVMNLMTMGPYESPDEVWMPSVQY